MNKKEFIKSLENTLPPEEIHPLLEALWYDAKGNWQRAHEIVQDLNSKAAARIHAYLHRKEGDLMNAEYWYMKAERKMPELANEFENEWIEILDDLVEMI